MRIAKIGAVVVLVYVAFVAIMELTFGYLQPDMDGGVVLTSYANDGSPHVRTLAGFRFNEKLYVSSNHWLRGWYNRALQNPRVDVLVEDDSASYIAVPVTGAERDELADAYRMGFILRAICGFAPSKFIRLDPVLT